MMENNTAEYNGVRFTPESLELFKQKFNEAKKENQHYFFFEDKEYFLGYAKYVVEYLDCKFKKVY